MSDDWFERALDEDEEGASLTEDVALDYDRSASSEETSSSSEDEADTFSFGASEDGSTSSSGVAEEQAPTSSDTADGTAPEDDLFALGAVEPTEASAGDESVGSPEPSSSESSEAESVDVEDTADEGDPFALGAVESTEPSASDSAPEELIDGGSSSGSDGESLFEEDFASALGDVELPEPTPSDSPGGNAAEEDDPFALGATGSAESSADDDEGGLFEEDFASALENVDVPGVDDGPGGGGASDISFGLGSTGGDDFEGELDSDLPRIDLGIEGLDRMIQGGVPERTLIAAIGEAGTGKTTFGLQFLDHGLSRGENAVFITLEETRQRVINSATEKGYPFDEYEAEGSLAVVDIDPIEMANSLASIQNELPVLIEEFGASRLVLDSVSLLEMMYEDRAKRRNEIFDFTRSLKEAGVTAMLTSEASEETPHASRYGVVEYLTDAVFVLQYIRPDDFRETRMAIEIQKIRDANHSREKKPYEITGEGISVYQQANLF